MIVVVGAGVAGLTAVEHLATRGVPVTLLTAGHFGTDSVSAGNTALAQGGIAAAMGQDDSPALHLRDTVAAGAGLVDPTVADILAKAGVDRVQELLNAGFPVDRDTQGRLVFGVEAAHSRPRVLHAGEDSSGAALSAFLTNRVQQLADDGQVRLMDQASLTDLVVTNGNISGLRCNSPAGKQQVSTNAVILATGGYAGLFPTTSSSPAITGQGMLAAARAGAVLADMEFLQFHPTVLAGSRQLLSEAVRGAGAVLRDPEGQRFMVGKHPEAELAPRDVVSKASFTVMNSFGTDSVFLDATVIEERHGPGTLAHRFPQLTTMLRAYGIEWTKQYVPVAPAAHYCMGGIATDTWARTSIRGLFAAGEVASTGVHGANRLASNSLLEGLVFGARAAETAHHFLRTPTWPLGPQFRRLIDAAVAVPSQNGATADSDHQLHKMQQLVATHLGIIRKHEGLAQLLRELDDITHPVAALVRIMATAALARTESRGGHWREDYPDSDPRQVDRTAWRLTTTQTNPDRRDRAHRTKENTRYVDA